MTYKDISPFGAELLLTSLQKLKFRLLAEGMTVSHRASAKLAAGSPNGLLTLADYASTSGIPIRLSGGIWVNTPISDHNPNFVKTPSCQLDWKDGEFVLRTDDNEWTASPLPIPPFGLRHNSQGEPFSNFGLTHTDRVRISPISGCSGSCSFCDLPRQVTYRCRDAALLVETIQAALADPVLPAKHILISGGTPRKEDYGYLKGVYEEVLAAFPSIPVDIMMLPLPQVLDLEALHKQGLNGLSINLELFNDQWRQRLIPEKNAISKKNWFEFLEKAVELFGSEARSMLMVGLEPLEDTLEGVRALAERKCTPVLSPFRPAPLTPFAHHPAPTAEYLEEAYLRSLDICVKYNVKLGPQCIPCQHNTLTFPDGSDYYRGEDDAS